MTLKRTESSETSQTKRQRSPTLSDEQGNDKKHITDESAIECPYLDTINRPVLDFDFEKQCSISLSHLNVYCCLVCGKYFQGRGQTSHAYFHSVDENHHVFIHLKSLKVYCLPENYEIKDRSLRDIQYVIDPIFTKEDVAKLDMKSEPMKSLDLGGKEYIAGFTGMNNIKANDYMNVVVQALAHVKPIRDFFLLNHMEDSTELVKRFGLLVRKMWNSRAFKVHQSPHELLQEVTNRSQKKFRLTSQSDACEFLTWFLNAMHLDLAGSRTKPSIITKCFQGELLLTTRQIIEKQESKEHTYGPPVKKRVPFLMLSLDLPPMPLFTDEFEKNIIPQVPLGDLLVKYDGETKQETLDQERTFSLIRLPPFLIFHMKRFSKNNFTVEKNHTVVNFPLKDVDFSELIPSSSNQPRTPLIYDLTANVVHDGNAESGSYKLFLRHRGSENWFQIQDLLVGKTLPQTIFLSESYIQIWERRLS